MGFFEYEVLVSNPAYTVDTLGDVIDYIFVDIKEEPRVITVDAFMEGTSYFAILVGTDMLDRAEVKSLVFAVIAKRYGSDFIVLEK